MSGPTYAKAKMIVNAADKNPEAYGPLLDKMDRTGKVDGVWRKLPGELRQRLPRLAVQDGAGRAIRGAVCLLLTPWRRQS